MTLGQASASTQMCIVPLEFRTVVGPRSFPGAVDDLDAPARPMNHDASRPVRPTMIARRPPARNGHGKSSSAHATSASVPALMTSRNNPNVRYRDRQRQRNQQRPHDRVHQPEQQRRPEQCPRAFSFDAGHELRGEPQPERDNQYADQESRHGRMVSHSRRVGNYLLRRSHVRVFSSSRWRTKTRRSPATRRGCRRGCLCASQMSPCEPSTAMPPAGSGVQRVLPLDDFVRAPATVAMANSGNSATIQRACTRRLPTQEPAIGEAYKPTAKMRHARRSG